MLKVFFGNMPEAIYNTAVYYKNDYEDEWIVDPRVKEMICDVDRSDVMYSGVIDSPILCRPGKHLSSTNSAAMRIISFKRVL